MSQPPSLLVGVLTLNEASRIAQCIESAQFADRIVVVDSGSEDATVDIAEQLGAEVYVYPDWQGFAVQRNRLLSHCHEDYVFFLDADEVITSSLQTEIETVVQRRSVGVWEIVWDQVVFGQPLSRMRETSGLPRLFEAKNIVGYEGVVHERAILRDASVPVYRFKSRLLHYSRDTIYGSIQKLAQYARLGATKRALLGRKGGVMRGFASAFASFLKLYIVRRGFLCGGAGFLYCLFVGLECFFRYVMIDYDRDHLEARTKR
jgi:glycosyltransferase involved in cell wall biosynthesis